jgi:hypothetical protein
MLNETSGEILDVTAKKFAFLCLSKVLGSDLGPETGCIDWFVMVILIPSRQMPASCKLLYLPLIQHLILFDHFLPYPCQFTNCAIIHRYTI